MTKYAWEGCSGLYRLLRRHESELNGYCVVLHVQPAVDVHDVEVNRILDSLCEVLNSDHQ